MGPVQAATTNGCIYSWCFSWRMVERPSFVQYGAFSVRDGVGPFLWDVDLCDTITIVANTRKLP